MKMMVSEVNTRKLPTQYEFIYVSARCIYFAPLLPTTIIIFIN